MNFAAIEYLDNPYPQYAQWRQEQPIWWAEDVQAWILSRYDDVRSVLKDPKTFSSDLAASHGGNTMKLPLLHDDPPRHTQLRAIVNRTFTTKAMKLIEVELGSLVEELLGKMDPDEPIDIAANFTVPLPVAVIARLMGIPVSRSDDFKRWSDSLTGTGNATSMEARMPDIIEMMEYFRAEIPKRVTNPGNDLISKVVSAQVDGSQLSEEEAVGFCQLLLIAGNETTTNLLSNLLHYLADHAQLWTELRAQPEKVEAAIEEILRYEAPVHWVNRVARVATEIHGQKIAAGDAVFTILGAANRDPLHYDQPDEFRLDRPRTDHHTFGFGIHFCIGAPLARLEAKYALDGLLRKFSGIRHAPDNQNERTHSSMLRGYHHLWLTFEAA